MAKKDKNAAENAAVESQNEAKKKKKITPNSIVIGLIVLVGIVVCVLIVSKNFKTKQSNTVESGSASEEWYTISDQITGMIKGSNLELKIENGILYCIGKEAYYGLSYTDNFMVVEGYYTDAAVDDATKIAEAEAAISTMTGAAQLGKNVTSFSVNNNLSSDSTFASGSVDMTLRVTIGEDNCRKDFSVKVPTTATE